MSKTITKTKTNKDTDNAWLALEDRRACNHQGWTVCPSGRTAMISTLVHYTLDGEEGQGMAQAYASLHRSNFDMQLVEDLEDFMTHATLYVIGAPATLADLGAAESNVLRAERGNPAIERIEIRPGDGHVAVYRDGREIHLNKRVDEDE